MKALITFAENWHVFAEKAIIMVDVYHFRLEMALN